MIRHHVLLTLDDAAGAGDPDSRVESSDAPRPTGATGGPWAFGRRASSARVDQKSMSGMPPAAGALSSGFS
ncbi:MAG: hypothetical protein ACE5GB_11565, partial [Acidimicrobiales bacterium]